MARTFAGGSDRITVENTTPAGQQTIALRFKTTQASANTIIAARWTSGSRSGWSLILNNTAGKVTIDAWGPTSELVKATGATTVNDGNWHSLVATFGNTSGNNQFLYIDGVLDASTTASGNWTMLQHLHLSWGNIGFWAPYVGELADVGMWTNTVLTAEDAVAYHNGFSPRNIRPENLEIYAPLVRDPADKLGTTTSLFGSTTVSDHPRVMGSMV